MVNKRLSSHSRRPLGPVSTSPPFEDPCAASHHVVAQWVAEGKKWQRSLNKLWCFVVKVLIVLSFVHFIVNFNVLLTESSIDTDKTFFEGISCKVTNKIFKCF